VGIFGCLAGHWVVSAKNVGLDVVWAFENGSDARLSKMASFMRFNHREIPFSDNFKWFMEKQRKQADIIMGSPPCIGISTGNPNSKTDHAANQGMLMFADAVMHDKPSAFIMEMVAMFKKSTKFYPLYKQYMEKYQDEYNIISPILDLENYGSPTERERVFFIGFHKDLDYKPTIPKPLNTTVTARETFAKAGLDNPTEEEAVRAKRTQKWNPNWKGPYSSLTRDPNFFTLPEDGPGRTFTAVGGSLTKHPDNHRCITKEEAKVLMGLPKDYRINAGFSTVIRACAWGVPVQSLDVIIKHVSSELAIAKDLKTKESIA